MRRIAYTILALFRSVTLRSDDGRAMPWKALFLWLRDALVAALPEHTQHQRIRAAAAR